MTFFHFDNNSYKVSEVGHEESEIACLFSDS